MKKYGLTHWVVFLTLVPTLVIGILLGSLFTSQRFNEVQDSLLKQGISIVEPLAVTAEHGLVTKNREQLKRLLSAVHRKHTPNIKSITLFDATHHLIVSSNYHPQFDRLRLPADKPLPMFTVYSILGDTIILHTPVMRETSPLSLLPASNDLEAEVLGYVVLELSQDGVFLSRHRAMVKSVGIIAIGLLLSLFFAMRLVRKVTHPIRRMVEAIERIRKGDLETHLNTPEVGELNELKNGINAMAKSIKDHNTEMVQNVDEATSDLRQTLELLEVQNLELGMAKTQAQEAVKIKSEFLANMSHELRTPLNGIIGFTRQLAKSSLNVTQHEHLRTIDTSASNLLNLINDILDLSKLEAGKLTFKKAPFAFRDVIDEVMLLLAHSATEKHVELAVNVATELPDQLIGDALRLRQVFTNLIGNAVKFTDVGSVLLKVMLVSEERNSIMIRCEVQDTGTGIASDMQAELFQAFSQADSGLDRREGGTGLGLVITKKLINQMGGEIGVQSKRHKGSNFWCTMCFQANPEPEAPPIETGQLAGKTALVMEPQLHNRESIQPQLKAWQIIHRICSTTTEWQSALEQKQHYDLILLAVDELTEKTLEQAIHDALEQCDRLVLMGTYAHRRKLPKLSVSERERTSWYSKPLHPFRLANAIINGDASEPTATADVNLLRNQANYRLLAVDDNSANLKLLKELLLERFEHVVTASSGKEAIKHAKETAFDLIFMDIQMPELDGVATTRTIRRLRNNSKTPVVAVTAHALPQEKEALLQDGLDDYLAKPILEPALEQVLARWLPTAPLAPQAEQTTDYAAQFASPFIDWETAVNQSNGRELLAKELIEMVLRELPESIKNIKKGWEQEERIQFQSAVHKLHGGTCYAGMVRLQSLTNSIETALKQDAELASLEPEYLELMDILDSLSELNVTAANA